MEKLVCGKTTAKEIADWMGIRPATFSAAREAKLKELEFFCDFEIDKGGKIIITNVKFDTYSRRGSRNYEIVKKEFPKQWNKDKIDQCSNVAQKIQDTRKEELTTRYVTTYSYTSRVKKYYIEAGRYIQKPQLAIRKRGKDGYYIYRDLAPTEKEIVKRLLKEMFDSDQEQELLVLNQQDKGDITSEQALNKIKEIKSFSSNAWLDFLDCATIELKLTDGEEVTRATHLEENACWKEEELTK